MAASIIVSPRFQAVPRAKWPSAEEARVKDWGGEVAGVVRIRCFMRDCPSDLGAVIWARSDQGPYPYDWYEYWTPRGMAKDVKDSGSAYSRGRRTRARIKWGLPLTGRRPHGGLRDWNARAPLGRREMGGDTYGLDDSPLSVDCTDCPRTVRFTRADVQAYFASLLQR